MPGKDETLRQLDEGYAAFSAVVDRIDEAHGTWEGAVGTWSVVHVLQHMTGWLDEMTAALERMARGERPTPAGVDYGDVDGWNSRFVAARGAQSLSAARSGFDQAHTTFRAAAAALPADRFGEGKTADRLVDGTALHHYAEHAAQLEDFLSGTH